MTKIVATAILEGISTRQDKSFKVVLGTQEIDKSKVADLFSLVNQFCKILITDNNVVQDLDEQLVEGIKVQATKKTKSHSQRLRNVIWRLWEANGAKGSFDEYYANQMERIIDNYREALE